MTLIDESAAVPATWAALTIAIGCSAVGRELDAVIDRLQAHRAAGLLLVEDESSSLYVRQRVAHLARAGTRTIRAPRRDTATLANVAVRQTATPYLAVIASSRLIKSDDLSRCLTILETRPEIGLVFDDGVADPEVAASFWAAAPEWARGLPVTIGGLWMIRRDAWTAVGGFDETLGELAILDFILSASELHIQWSTLGAAAVTSATRPASSSQEARRSVFERHASTLGHRGPEIFLAYESARLQADSERRRLERKLADVEREAADLNARIAAVAGELAAKGISGVDWGVLRRLAPISDVWGLDRGRPLDRYYIENFLERHRADITGRVLEIKDPWYTELFGSNVTHAEILDMDAGNRRATIVADLTKGDNIPSESFDCFVFTQTLHIIYDTRAALANAYRLLKPGGVLLCTVPSVSRINYEDGGLDDGDFWRFTEASIRRLFAEVFPLDTFEVSGFGNVLTCAAFLYGLAPTELTSEELDFVDPWFPLGFCVRAVKPIR